MTRREGIIKRANSPENAKILLAAGSIQALILTEYKNYCELCEYCYEQPKSFVEWTREKIKPVKENK